MTIDGLLTFFALLVAVLSVMSRGQRLNLRLKVGTVHMTFSILALLWVNALLLGWVTSPACWPEARNLAYLIILISVLVLSTWVHLLPLPRKSIRRFQALVEELNTPSQAPELLNLMDSHLERLVRIYNANFVLPRLRKWLESCDPAHGEWLAKVLEKLNHADGPSVSTEEFPLFTKMKRVAGRCAGTVARLFPSDAMEQRTARETIRGVLLRTDFTRYVVQTRPYFGLRILSLEIDEKYEFSEEYLREMLAIGTSVLYWEVKNNQNLSSSHRYELPEENRLLRFLFHDARVAEKLGVWQPIGEQMLTELDRLHRDAENDPYNGPFPDDYRERGQWKSSFFVGIRFFDIMVSEAIDQDIRWHMRLYYFTYLTDRICRNYRLDPEKIDANNEFPTIYSYLLHEIVWTLRQWIWKVRELPAGQSNVVLETVSPSHENGNPVKSAILVLGECLRTVLCDDKIPARLKRSLGSTGLNLFFELVRHEAQAGYAEVLRQVLVVGGLFERRDEGYEYLGNIINALVNNDNVPHRIHGGTDHVLALLTTLVHRFFEKFDQEQLSGFARVEPWNDGQIRISSDLTRHAYVITP